MAFRLLFGCCCWWKRKRRRYLAQNRRHDLEDDERGDLLIAGNGSPMSPGVGAVDFPDGIMTRRLSGLKSYESYEDGAKESPLIGSEHFDTQYASPYDPSALPVGKTYKSMAFSPALGPEKSYGFQMASPRALLAASSV